LQGAGEETLQELSHASTLEGKVATLKCELRLKERKAAQHKADLTLGKRFLRSAMREVNELDPDFELGVAEPNNDPAVAIPELVRHVRSLNSVQNSCANVCDVARHRASALACHIRLDGVFSLDTAETKAALGITQAAADSAKQDAEEAHDTYLAALDKRSRTDGGDGA
jgi:hypothetical protein